MINELKKIIDGLEVESVHPDLATPGGREALRVILNEDGSVENLEYIDQNKLGDIWVLKTSNQDYFPVIKLKKPLRPLGNESYVAYSKNEKNKNFDKECEFLDKFAFEENNDWLGSNHQKSIKKRRNELSAAEELKIKEVHELYQRFLKFCTKGLRVLDEKIEKMLKQKNISDEKLKNLLMEILFGKVKVVKGKIPDNAKTSLIFDYLPSKENDVFATSADNYEECLSRYFIGLERSSGQRAIGACPIMGSDRVLINDKFPEINLGKGKFVSKICFYSKYSGNVGATVKRYHKDGIESYTIDRELAQKFTPALKKLTDDKNKGKTWLNIPSEGKQQDLFIAFCHADFNLAVTYYACSFPEDNKVDGFDDYSNRTSDLISNHVDSNGNLNFDSLVDFYVFRKVSDGAQKIIYSSTKAIRFLKEAKERWITACQNVPNFKLKVNFREGVKLVAPWSLAPIELTKLSRYKYKINGKTLDVPAISFTDMMTIFFDVDNRKQSLVSSCLNKVIYRWYFLFELCEKNRKNEDGKREIYEWNANALQATTIISALLYKLNRTKELYMNDFSYKLGQFLSAIDELHVGYCMDVRKGSIPNVLIGNMVYAVALQNPDRALDILALRLKPYQAWVNKKAIDSIIKDHGEEEKIRKAVNNAIYAYKWLKSEKICDLLNNKITDPLSQTHKAELMLGYLAGRPFPAKNASDK